MIPVLDPAEDPLARRLGLDVQPLTGFDQAAAAVLGYLGRSHALGLWTVTRTAGEDWVLLHCAGNAYPVQRGDVLRWSESMCSRMVRGDGPRVAPRAMDVAAYAASPIAGQLAIGSYIGVPLIGPAGEVLGTLCGIDPEPAGDDLSAQLPLFELQARLLSGLLSVELTGHEQERRADALRQRVDLDPQTGLIRRDGWDRALEREQVRCRQHASPASVIVMEVDDPTPDCAGRERVRGAARVLLASCRAGDLAASTGPSEFAVLCPLTPETVAETVATRLQERLQREGIEVSCGVAGLDPRDGDLSAAWKRAGAIMDEDRRHGAP